MKAREAAQNLKRFEAETKSQKVKALEYMINDFDQMASELERQVFAEEERTGIRDTSHFAYSTFARSAKQRKIKLRASIADLKAKLEEAIAERDGVLSELDQPHVNSDIVLKRENNLTHPHETNGPGNLQQANPS